MIKDYYRRHTNLFKIIINCCCSDMSRYCYRSCRVQGKVTSSADDDDRLMLLLLLLWVVVGGNVKYNPEADVRCHVTFQLN